MSKYTTTIRSLIENGFDLGLKDYPIFNESYRDTLNNNIIKHYYIREIGLETAELFKLYLNQRMNEIMPYYNGLYLAQEKALLNMFDNVDLKEQLERTTTSETSGNSTSDTTGKSLFQDTPQGKLKHVDIDEQEYATNLTQTKGNVQDSQTTEGTGIENYVKTLTGNNGKKYNVELLGDVKDKLMNIDLMIINDLNELFMGIY